MFSINFILHYWYDNINGQFDVYKSIDSRNLIDYFYFIVFSFAQILICSF